MHSQKIVLLGMAGVGKSSIGKLLAKHCKLPFIDLDLEIENKTQEALQKSLDRLGDSDFLELEKTVFEEVADRAAIYAPGGSFIYLLDHFQKGFTYIYLNEHADVLMKRIDNINTRGIVGIKENSFESLVEERAHLGKKYAHLFIECRNRPKKKIVDEILNTLDQKKITFSKI